MGASRLACASRLMSVTVGVPTNESGVWRDSNGYFHPDGTPEGFTLRTCAPGETPHAETMLEKWEAGTAEPPHSHPGDDMTVVIEGKMEIQFFNDDMTKDGAPVTLVAGQSGLSARPTPAPSRAPSRAHGLAMPPGGPTLLAHAPCPPLRHTPTRTVKANRIHDAKYLEACKLVYVHDGPFGFEEKK